MPFNVKHQGSWKQSNEIFIKDNDQWKACQDVYVNKNGLWKSALFETGGVILDSAGTHDLYIPSGVFNVTYTIYGAGGGSGACNNNGDAWVGAGGGAGGKRTGTLSVTPGETLTAVVGNRGYGASYRFNSNYSYNPNNSTLGVGTDGGDSQLKRGSSVLADATGGTKGAQYYQGNYGTGGQPEVPNTSPPSHTGDGDGERGSAPDYKGYGYTGPIKGGTNGSGTPPSGSNRGTGYGNGGGQAGLGVGVDGQDGAIIVTWFDPSTIQFTPQLSVDGGVVDVYLLGGRGGASGPDFRYGGTNMKLRIRRVGTTTPQFLLEWTYNEVDYLDLGAGSLDISQIIPVTSNGSFDVDDTGTYVMNTTQGYNGRDQRDLAVGSRIDSDGVRSFWFATSNKAASMDSGVTTYNDVVGTISLGPTNNQRSAIIANY